jgi:formylglycine-generating enzyme required for sulfatase activity
MKYVEAKNVTYTMGKSGGSGAEAEHSATLSKSYYIGIYTITQGQWKRIVGWYPQSKYSPSDAATRDFYPVQYAAYNEIREVAPVDNNVLQSPNNSDSKGSTGITGDDTYAYPAAPAPVSWLGLLSSHAGVSFDLPGECEWEYACRAGNYGNKWGDGSNVLGGSTDANLALLGRYLSNSGSHIWPVGTLAPNSWGLYDMHGNVWEWCLDYFQSNISSLNGAVNTTKPSDEARTERGGSFLHAPVSCTSSYRTADQGNTRYPRVGFRVVSRIEP